MRQLEVATNLEAIRGQGTAGPVTGSADGKYLFCNEGATMVIIEPVAVSGAGVSDFPDSTKEFTLGEFGIGAVRMVVDPASDFGNGDTLSAQGLAYKNYVFIAAGKNGLWMVDGDIAMGSNRVGRIDDSGAGVAGMQFSNRYCNDVGILTVGGQTYVAAIFAKRQQSQLRLYEIEKVRAVLGAPGATGETGNEIAPDYKVVITRNPVVLQPSLAGAIQAYRSFATDLEIDQPAGAPTELYAYVAMMTDGILAGGSNTLPAYISYAREMDVLDSPSQGLHLVVTCGPVPLAVDPPRQLEGFAYTDLFNYGAVTYIFSLFSSGGARTNIYWVGDFPHGGGGLSVTDHTSILNGGSYLFVPKVQSNQLGAPGNQNVEFVHALTSGVNLNGRPGGVVSTKSYCMTSVDGSPIPTVTTPLTAVRPEKDLTGRRTFGLGHALLDPNLMQPGINDGTPREGVPYLSGTSGARSLDVIFDTSALGGDDFTFAGGEVIEQQGQWLGTVANTQFLIGEGRPSAPNTPTTPELKIVEQHIPAPVAGVTPTISEVLKFVQRPKDRWGKKGRELQMGGIVSPRYDQWIQDRVAAQDPGYTGVSLEGAESLFCFRHESPDGLFFGRRDKLMTDLAPVPPGGLLPDGSGANFKWFQLNTHPEFNQFPVYPMQSGFSVAEYNAAKSWFGQPARPMIYRQRLKTWAPRMACVRAEPGSSLDKGWVLL